MRRRNSRDQKGLSTVEWTVEGPAYDTPPAKRQMRLRSGIRNHPAFLWVISQLMECYSP